MKIEEKRIPIYSGSLDDFHWAGFGTGSGTNLNACAEVIKPSLIFSNRLKTHSKATLFQQPQLSEKRGIIHEAIKAIDITGFRPIDGDTEKLATYERRCIEYDEMIVDMLHKYEERQQAPFDLIVLGGYMRLVMAPLLEAYRDRMINVHPADLSIVKQHEEIVDDIPKFYRVFVGDNAVYDVIKAGETLTKSSVIMVDGGIDHGEILTQGPSLLVLESFLSLSPKEQERQLEKYVDGTKRKKGHQERLKEVSDWPALTSALEMIANGRIDLGTEKKYLNEWRKVYVDGNPMDYMGFQVK